MSLFRFFVPIFCLFLTNSVVAQNKYRNPIDGKLLLSANFGELRANHFHMGIDLKVGGKVGAKVYAVDDAYVYRLSVSPTGYGNCVYLKHPNGNTTVYAHLHKFNSRFANFIKNEQYARQSFAVDTTFTEEYFQVKRGELIGFVGNSGSSFGPHLHFEVRTNENSPFNPIPNLLSVNDNVAPIFNALSFFTLDNVGKAKIPRVTDDIKFTNTKEGYQINKVVEVESPLFFGVDCIDRVSETHNKLGIRKMRIDVDDKTIFSFTIDSLHFATGRHINSFQIYSLLLNQKRNVIQTYVEPGNNLDIFDVLENQGLIELNDDFIHKVSICLIDDYNNKSTLNFKIKRKSNRGSNDFTVSDMSRFIHWKLGRLVIVDGLLLTVNPESFYDNLYIDVAKKDTVVNSFSFVYSIDLKSQPVHKPLDVAIRANVPDNLAEKVLLAGMRNGKVFAVNAKIDSSMVKAKISSSADYFVAVDTIAPEIKPLFKSGADIKKVSQIKIKITDDFSGIKDYKGLVDGKWALFEYDAKKNMLIYNCDPQKISRNTKHSLKLTVGDWKNNVAEFESSFIW